MNKIALCFLVYGDEHIKEFNELIKSLPNSNIFVITNDKSKIEDLSINIIETQEEFNFNLKRYVIKEAFKQYDTIVLLDTDIKINSNFFSKINNLNSDGMWVKWIDPKLTHKGTRLDIRNNQYCIELNKLNTSNLQLQFIPEFCVIIKIKDINKRIQFTNLWNDIHFKIKKYEPTDRHHNLKGAIEGCIMYLSCLNLGINIKTDNSIFDLVTHYASTQFHKTII